MARTPATQVQVEVQSPMRRRRARFAPSFTLALWRLRPMWRLLLIAGLGNIAAVLLVCIVPLFTQVALSAGIRSVLNGPTDATHIIVNGYGTTPTPQNVAAIQQQLDQIVSADMGRYAQRAAPRFSISLQGLELLPADLANPSPIGSLQITGADTNPGASQYTLVSGRWPAITKAPGANLEIALTPSDAAGLGVHVGSILRTQLINMQPEPLTLHVVGLYLLPPPRSATGVFLQTARVLGPGGQYMALASNQATIMTLAAVAAKGSINAQGPQTGPPPFLLWSYALDDSQINANSLNDVIDRLNKVQTDVSGQLSGAQGVQGLFLDAGAYQALTTFRIQILLLQIPLLLLLLQVIALILLFVRMMADMLVDRQAEAIATLRSRGATRRQVFNTFTLHNIGLSLIALVVGPLAAIPVVRALAERALPATSQNALTALAGNPLAIAWGLRWYVLVAVVVSGVAMVFSTNRAASNTIVALRRENARTGAKPFWQRLNLDLIFGAVSLLGYVAYTIAVRQVNPTIQLVLSPVALIASLLMLIAAALLFLRALPLALTLAARLATRGRSATSMLALTQMARAPKQPVRMTLLLALATAFTLFTLVYSASQAQRLLDVATFQTGADFAGTLPVMLAERQSLGSLAASYRQIPGVTAVSLGYSASISASAAAGSFPLQVYAVDPDSYAQAALWTDQESAQPLSGLMSQLRAARPAALANDTVPALVDDATWQAMQLTVGARFSLPSPGYGVAGMAFTAIGHVPYLPGVYDSYQGGGFSGSGGVLADYQSYAAAYHHDLTTTLAPVTLSPNYAWIATHHDAASLASARKALSVGSLALSSLQDTRQIIDDQRTNPLQIEFANTLLIGAATALLLALIGIWVGSWLNARGRLVNFAVLRALGTTPRQLRAMLVWEQAIVYLVGGALGIALGWVLSLTALPMLIFVELATTGRFQNVPNVPPAQVVVPGETLSVALGVLVAICLLALLLTMAALARLSLGQTLRLNED